MLDDRKAAILRSIVEEHIATGHPVGSAAVAKSAGLGVSSATVRNEMMVLEAQGYISQPHTSAGRIPTDRGYRYYVDHLSSRPRVYSRDRVVVAQFFARAHRELEDLMAASSRLLSHLTAYAAVVGRPQLQASRVRDVHLVSLGAQTVLAVVVTNTGRVERFVVEDAEHTEQDLARASQALSDALRGRSVFDAGPEILSTGSGLADDLARRVLAEVRRWTADPASAAYYLGGASNLVSAAAELAEVHHVLDALEKQVAVVTLLSEALEQAHLVVRIGSENEAPEMKEWSVVTAPYQCGGRPLGAVGVVGPTRMDYARAISAVEAVSAALGDALGSLRAE